MSWHKLSSPDSFTMYYIYKTMHTDQHNFLHICKPDLKFYYCTQVLYCNSSISSRFFSILSWISILLPSKIFLMTNSHRIQGAKRQRNYCSTQLNCIKDDLSRETRSTINSLISSESHLGPWSHNPTLHRTLWRVASFCG